jgi:anti-sigma regulatory factor (Ser/Thr protein kinase)
MAPSMAMDLVGDGEQPSIPLPATAHASRIARAFVERHTRDRPAELVEDALVLVSELVTNAVLHGEPDIHLQLRLTRPGIGVAVTDRGSSWPVVPGAPFGTTARSGRGLLIVNALATQWGVRPSDPPPGKVVWFELQPSSGEDN